MPALHVGGARVARREVDARGEGVVSLRRYEAFRVTLLCHAEAVEEIIAGAEALRRLLRYAVADDVRPVESQQVFAAQSIEMDVTDPVTAANHRPIERVVCEADARRPVVVIRVNQRAIVKRAV